MRFYSQISKTGITGSGVQSLDCVKARIPSDLPGKLMARNDTMKSRQPSLALSEEEKKKPRIAEVK